MKLPKEINTVTPLSKTIALIMFIFLPFAGFAIGLTYKNTFLHLYTQCVSYQTKEPIQQRVVPRLIKFRGTVKLEAIAKSQSDKMLWFYFDEPYLLENSTLGKPVYVNKLRINAQQEVISSYIDKHTEISGNIEAENTETPFIHVLAITELK